MHECSFDAFCKKAIRDLAVDAKRIYWKKNTIASDDELLAKYLKLLRTEDTYDLSKYEKIYYVNGINVVVKNETVGEALKFIMPNKRAVLLLSYFMDYRDCEIARTLRITNSTVSYRRNQALKQLKVLLEDKVNVSVKCYLTGGISPSRLQHFTRIYGKMRKNEKSAQGIKSLGTTKIG